MLFKVYESSSSTDARPSGDAVAAPIGGRGAPGPGRRDRATARLRVALGVAGPAALAALLPGPAAVWAQVRDGSDAVTVLGAAMLLAVSVLVWGLLAWAVVVTGATLLTRMPGAAGRIGRTALLALAPATARRLLIVAAGVCVVTGVSSCAGAAPSGANAAGQAVVAATDAGAMHAGGIGPAYHDGGYAGPGGPAASRGGTRAPDLGDPIDLDWPMPEPVAAGGGDGASAAPGSRSDTSVAPLAGPTPPAASTGSSPSPATHGTGSAGASTDPAAPTSAAPARDATPTTGTVGVTGATGPAALPTDTPAAPAARGSDPSPVAGPATSAGPVPPGATQTASATAGSPGRTGALTATGADAATAPGGAAPSAAGTASAAGPGGPPGRPGVGMHPGRSSAGASDSVTVRPGDSLWTIAARHLPAGATDAQIDAGWRGWYAANRSQIGPDPDLILPGQRLVTPEAHAATEGASP